MVKHNKGNQVSEWLSKARDKWQYTGRTRPPFAEEPKPGQRSVWDFPRPPALVPFSKKIEVRSNRIQLGCTTNALELKETASPPTYYLPPEDINFDLLVALSQRTSLCEWKGEAAYWALKTAPEKAIAWSYAKPFEGYTDLVDHVAFYPQYLECYVNGEKARPQSPEAFMPDGLPTTFAGHSKETQVQGIGDWFCMFL